MVSHKLSRNSSMIGEKSFEFQRLKEYFLAHMEDHPLAVDILGADSLFDQNTFSFWCYLNLCVRDCVDVIFSFGLLIWTLIVITFCALCFAHVFAHMGYIR